MAADFFTTEMLFSLHGLITFYTLFVIDLPSRWVHLCGTTLAPNAQWMIQIARNLTDAIYRKAA